MKTRNLLIVLMVSILFASCGKDDFVNYEDALFNELSRGGGIWTVESIADYQVLPDGTDSLISEQTPDVQYIIYPYANLESGLVTYVNTLTTASRDTSGQVTTFHYSIWAEKTRITLYDGINSQFVYTIVERSRNRHVWQRFTVDYATQATTKRIITLRHCSSCEPYYKEHLHISI